MTLDHAFSKNNARRLVLEFLFRLKLPTLFRWLNRDRVAILAYHGVMPDDAAEAEGNSLQVRASDFRRQMEYLKKHYEVCSLHEAHSRLGKPGPKPRAVVTFDDGYANNYLVVFPILKELNIPAVIFLVTGKIGTDQVFWWDRLHLASSGIVVVEADFIRSMKRVRAQAVDEQADGYLRRLGLRVDPAQTKYYRVLNRDEITEMAASGLIEFGCHTHDHEPLNTLHWREIEATLRDSMACLESLVGPARYFAAPYGDYDSYTFPSLRLFQFELAMSTQVGFLSAATDRLRVPRLDIGRECSLANFACITSGLVLWLHRYKYACVGMACVLAILAGVVLV